MMTALKLAGMRPENLFLLSPRVLRVLVKPVQRLEDHLIDTRLARMLIPFEPVAIGLRQLHDGEDARNGIVRLSGSDL